MKLQAGILGYGNLGKSLENNILECSQFELKAIFSRRNIANKLYVPTRQIAEYKGKLDVLFIALGSYNDTAENVRIFAAFDTVDSFDTHAKIAAYKKLLNGEKPNTVSVCATGWDPGILSICRGIFALGGGKTATFWGEGISQGHSNALRAIQGVLDAVEITAPIATAVENSKRGEFAEENLRHERICYVACVESDKKRVEREIREIPNYFAGQKVTVHFCSAQEVREIRQNTQHAGTVIACGDGYTAQTRLDVVCNTDFTAKIMIAYAKAIPQLKRDGYVGALDPFDIPLKYLVDSNLV